MISYEHGEFPLEMDEKQEIEIRQRESTDLRCLSWKEGTSLPCAWRTIFILIYIWQGDSFVFYSSKKLKKKTIATFVLYFRIECLILKKCKSEIKEIFLYNKLELEFKKTEFKNSPKDKQSQRSWKKLKVSLRLLPTDI